VPDKPAKHRSGRFVPFRHELAAYGGALTLLIDVKGRHHCQQASFQNIERES
jgi:hypothetical protein